MAKPNFIIFRTSVLIHHTESEHAGKLTLCKWKLEPDTVRSIPFHVGTTVVNSWSLLFLVIGHDYHVRIIFANHIRLG